MNGGLPSIYQTGDHTATWETATAVIAAGASQSGLPPPTLPEDVGEEAEAGYRGQLTEPARTQLYLSQGDLEWRGRGSSRIVTLPTREECSDIVMRGHRQ